MLTSRFTMLQPGFLTIAIHILPNISQSKGSQKMKFVQVKENTEREIFPQKSCLKQSRKTSFKPLIFL